MSCLTVLSGCHRFLHWVLSFAVPGLGMFNEVCYAMNQATFRAPIDSQSYSKPLTYAH